MRVDPVFVEKAGDDLKGHLNQLYGDLRFRQIDKKVWQGITTAVGMQNLDTIESYYRRSERLGWKMPDASLRRYAQTLAARGDDVGAMEIVERMPANMDPPRYMLVRDLIERRVMTESDPASERITRLVKRFEKELESESDLAKKQSQQVWAMSVRAERLLQSNDPDGVITMLVEGGLLGLREKGATPRDLAPLTVRLGEAYAKLGKLEDARMQLLSAQSHLVAGDVLNPRIMVALGNIELAEGQSGAYDRAYNHFRQAYETDPMGPSSIDAIIGLGHAEANRDGRFPEAIEWFTLAVQRILNDQLPSWDDRRKLLAYYLRDVHVVREFERGRYAESLELLKVYEPLESPKLVAQTLQSFASVYEKLGERELDKAQALMPDPSKPGEDPNLQARKLHNQEAAINFEQAADYFRRQASELTHTTEEHGEALWSAAKNYERSQLWRKAVEVYSDFLDTSDRQDRREEANFRVGQALLAEGQSEAAVQRLQQTIDDAPTGEWAKRAYVPLSQALSELKRWGEAEKLLRSVIEGHPTIGPESPYYHDALVALGRLMYNRGEEDPRFYARAIEVLGSEGGAVERYMHDDRYQRELPVLRYMLADCLRLSARGLIAAAESARTETERLAMLTERTRRLSDAQMYYNQVVVELERWHPDSFTSLELQYFRNAQFYQADCAFDRSDFETAISLYLNAVNRWQDHPVALVGWVQIMNARAELGQMEAARSAHARAIELFNQMPEGAFNRADSLMTRDRWDAWLQWMTELDLLAPNSETAGVRVPD